MNENNLTYEQSEIDKEGHKIGGALEKEFERRGWYKTIEINGITIRCLLGPNQGQG